MTFILSGDMKEKVFFDNWLEYINPTSSFDLNYRNDYVTTIRINQYDNQDNLAYSVDLFDAFPTAVNQLDMDWSSDGHLKLTVVFEYRYWQINSLQQLATNIFTYGLNSGLYSANPLSVGGEIFNDGYRKDKYGNSSQTYIQQGPQTDAAPPDPGYIATVG
jgi:hypothetical protein